MSKKGACLAICGKANHVWCYKKASWNAKNPEEGCTTEGTYFVKVVVMTRMTEYCCLLGSGAVWSNRRVVTIQKNLLHPCLCTLVMRAISSSEVAMHMTQSTLLHFPEISNLCLIMVCSRCSSKKNSVSQKILILCLLFPMYEDRSVGMATCYRLDGSGIESRWGRYFHHPSRPPLRSTQPPVQWVPGLSQG